MAAAPVGHVAGKGTLPASRDGRWPPRVAPKMAAAGPGLPRGTEAAAALFEAHTAAELREVERRLRAGIEQKREELRQMVGERYRDLIEAADTIAEMRLSAERLLGAVRGLQRGAPGPRGARGSQGAQPMLHSQEKFYSTAAQIKLLLEIPETIWSAMEASQYLRATQLYLLCCHLHSLLQLDSSSSRYSPILARFPILVRQVAAASHFRSTILHESKSLLKCQAVSDQAVAEALCSIMLLEDSSPRQALTDFLLARKSAVQQLLNQPHHGAGIKAQVCSLMELVTTTLYQAHALFYTLPEGAPSDPSLPCSLLFSMLETTTGPDPAGKGIKILKEEMKLSSWFKYLPLSVVEFQPTLRTLAHPISQDYLRDTLQKWINMCNEDIRSGLITLLGYVKSLKGLAGIRDAVWELLTGESMSQNWDTVCHRLLDKPISFWEDLLRQLFLDRLQVLVHSFTKTLLLDAAGSILAAATNWDEIEIQEETETGSSVTSKIRLPVQPSWYVQCLLFSLCQEVNRVGGHALPKRTLQLLLKTCLAEVLAGYETLVEEKQEKKEGTFPMTQNRALQLLYDLRYLNIVLTAKSEEAKTSRSKQDSRIEKVTDFLEANIDPFDLDVFTPHLNSSLNRLVQRTSVLFGLLTGAENQYTNRSNNLSSQEPYNILPLASSQIRFGLLPLSMSSSRRTKSAVKNTENQTQVPPPSVIRAEEETFRPGSLFRQLATEEEDTAAPSLFKLGWLSSMTK
ncbi:conserved oligomeric Golgi complex subunit 1 isoform 4-T5 [Macrochelys suwanniensis]